MALETIFVWKMSSGTISKESRLVDDYKAFSQEKKESNTKKEKKYYNHNHE